jgi:hypothetical protein
LELLTSFSKAAMLRNATSFQESVLSWEVAQAINEMASSWKKNQWDNPANQGSGTSSKLNSGKISSLLPEEFRDRLCPMPPKEFGGEKNEADEELQEGEKKEEKKSERSQNSGGIKARRTRELTNNGIFINQ